MQTLLTQAHKYLRYEDGALYRRISSGPMKAHSRAGGIKPCGYRYVSIGNRMYLEHRIIYLLCTGELPRVVDHIDGNPLNNLIGNLRACTHSQNLYNSKTPITNTSGIKGVSWDRSRNKWKARIHHARKEIMLGRFSTLQEAESAVTAARTRLHGEFARYS